MAETEGQVEAPLEHGRVVVHLYREAMQFIRAVPLLVLIDKDIMVVLHQEVAPRVGMVGAVLVE